jgi:heme-degrading monooxygenase HmoA
MIQSNHCTTLSWLVLTLSVCESYCYSPSILLTHGRAFLPAVSRSAHPLADMKLRRKASSISMTIAEKEEQLEKSALLPRERYVVFNRFQARDGAGPKFEKRWADRKSGLAKIDGFRFFTLLRRADDIKSTDGKLNTYPEGTPNYMSMTIWETKENFSFWRTSYAFKEAHGGGSIGGFLSALVSRCNSLQQSKYSGLTCPVPAACSSCRAHLRRPCGTAFCPSPPRVLHRP